MDLGCRQSAAITVATAMRGLPWISDVEPGTVLVPGQGLSGAISSSAYLFSPWADRLGGTG